MCLTTQQAAERQAAQLNLMRELVKSLEDVIGWVPGQSELRTVAASVAVERARDVLRRAKEQQ